MKTPLHDHHDNFNVSRIICTSDNIYVYTKEMDLPAHLLDVALVLADLEKNGITAKPGKVSKTPANLKGPSRKTMPHYLKGRTREVIILSRDAMFELLQSKLETRQVIMTHL